MPIRIVCPACSAALSVKDEFAGRAVKCPKCGGVIPPSEAAPAAAPPPPPPPAPPPEPEKSPFEALDESAKPAKAGSKITGKPASRAKTEDDDEDDRPRRKKRDEDDAPKSKRKRDNDRDDDDRDRPAKRRRRDDDDDDGNRPARGKKKGGGGGGVVVAILGGVLLVCCGGGGGLAYYLYTKARDKVEQIAETLETMNPRVTPGNYNSLQVGTTTRAQAEIQLGNGKTLETEDLERIFSKDAGGFDKWMPFVANKRALFWRNGEDYIIAAFHPDVAADARLQHKEWKPKTGPVLTAGNTNDAQFLRVYPPKKTTGPNPKGSGPIMRNTKVQAEDLTREFKTDPAGAAATYSNKTFNVDGKLSDIKVAPGGILTVILEGSDGMTVSCTMKNYITTIPFSHARGQRVVVEAECTGATAVSVAFKDGVMTGFEQDPAVHVTAASLVTAYRTDTSGDAMYKGKEVRISNARIEKLDPDGVIIAIPSGSTTVKKKIRIQHDPSYREVKFVPPLRVGGSITIRGKCEGVMNDEIVISGAWYLH